MTSTPHNSIMSLNVRIMKQLDSDDSKMNSSLSGPESFGSLKRFKNIMSRLLSFLVEHQ